MSHGRREEKAEIKQPRTAPKDFVVRRWGFFFPDSPCCHVAASASMEVSHEAG
jgi:hypothetical protein